MRLGLISDIHGNLLALDAVLEELEREGVDEIVCLGDVAVGPQPAEALARVRELGCPVVMGNWDAAFISGMPEPKDEVGEMLVEIGNWWAAFLSPDDRTFMLPRGYAVAAGPCSACSSSNSAYQPVIAGRRSSAWGGSRRKQLPSPSWRYL